MKNSKENNGTLYIVATPIGNLADITFRAIETLKTVDLIAAEDTRHIKMLLNHYGIHNKLLALHQHNENYLCDSMLEKLQSGLSIALVSDAGTPLISDPGMPLVKAAHGAGINVVPIVGACALIGALSASGLPVTSFKFVGFLPRTASARKTFFTEQLNTTETWVFYESCHRILECLTDMAEILPFNREIVIARELTKLHETIVKTSLCRALELVKQNENMRKGEFVVIVAGAEESEIQDNELTLEQEHILMVLLKECSLKTAVSLATQITHVKKKVLYQRALTILETNES